MFFKPLFLAKEILYADSLSSKDRKYKDEPSKKAGSVNKQ